MPTTFRVASFNVENLFSRAKILNLKNHDLVDEKLAQVAELTRLIHKSENFTAADKRRILELYGELAEYIEIREDREKLLNSSKTRVVAASGDAWDGEIVFKTERFSKIQRENTAEVIKKVRADVACIVEADDRPTMEDFDTHLLNSRFRYEMLIDANDRRGIDVGLYSRFPIGNIRTHMIDKVGNSTVFSRDCPEYETILPNGQSLHILCNHLKSKGYDYDGTASARRKSQAQAIVAILAKYDLKRDWVVVAGDMNDSPDSDPISPLRAVPDLHDILELQFGGDMSRRWTYHFRGAFDQIDYVLVSTPMRNAFRRAGVERRGIYGLNRLTSGTNRAIPVETEFDTVTHWTNGASDHGAVWAEFAP